MEYRKQFFNHGLATVLASLLLLSACASTERLPVPQEISDQATVKGIPDARQWGDVASEDYLNFLQLDDEQIQQHKQAIYNQEHNYLALSGGGARGAFGAGLLAGWAQRGDRPSFTMVSGVSTGALIAPYAFLGAKYDPVIREIYVAHSTDDLFRRRNVFSIVTGDSVMDVSGFVGLIKRYLPDNLIDEIAVQYRLGRELIVGTTNLDSERPVIWSIGAIAASDHPDRYHLVRRVIMASASLPVAFPPVMIPVLADGAQYDEMHVDGGVANQVFVYPLGMDWSIITQKLKVVGKPKLYVVRNAKLSPEWSTTDRNAVSIGTRSLDSLMRTQGLGDLYRIYTGALRDGIDYNLAYIPDDFVDTSTETVDADTMLELYNIGQSLGRNGYNWLKAPPGTEPVEPASSTGSR
jgi:predicted acylesterase/phospholipase RssA